MKTISNSYLDLNRELHQSDPHFGRAARLHIDDVASLVDMMKAGSVLDYGCGKGVLKPALQERFPNLDIREYDPGIPEKAAAPEKADVVACIDVMEHIELDFLDSVLKHIAGLADKAVYMTVALGPAKRILADGRNAHLIIKPVEWWQKHLDRHFVTLSKAKMFGNDWFRVILRGRA